ncbi:MAG: TPM domain-containing protein [Saprospiraceae bacterium]
MIDFFTKEQGDQIIAAIQRAESASSGEIRVHLEDNCKGNVLNAAKKTFRKLQMERTERRNGVIIFLAPGRKEFAIYGDEGINKVVPENYWQDVRDILQSNFREAAFAKGVIEAIDRVGEKLRTYFPGVKDDINELPDDISYGGMA